MIRKLWKDTNCGDIWTNLHIYFKDYLIVHLDYVDLRGKLYLSSDKV